MAVRRGKRTGWKDLTVGRERGEQRRSEDRRERRGGKKKIEEEKDGWGGGRGRGE